MIVFPVRIIMSPTSSSRLLAGRKARSATPLTMYLPHCGSAPCAPGAMALQPTQSAVSAPNALVHVTGAQYAQCGYFRTDEVHSAADEGTAPPPGVMADRGRARERAARRGLRGLAAPGRERTQGHLPARGRGREVPGL